MILYDLKCRKGHVFEAWFRDSTAYEHQARAGEVACPTCGSKKVDKAPMAPRLAKGRTRDTAEGRDESKNEGKDDGRAQAKAAEETAKAGAALRALREVRRRVEENFDYVGPNFAEEVRRIHYGEADPHSIYGETSEEEATALREEGIAFSRIPWPAGHDS